MQAAQAAMYNIIEESQGLNPRLAAARAKANSLWSYEKGPNIRLHKIEQAESVTAVPKIQKIHQSPAI